MALAQRIPREASKLHKLCRPDGVRAIAGSAPRLDAVSKAGKSWAKERLGVRRFDPIEEHRNGLVHRPGKVNPQKHTFDTEYFRSPICRDQLKVAWEGAVGLEIQDGCFVTVSRRDIKAGEIVEKGILRGIEMGVLDDKAPNPFVCKLGQDFLTSKSFPWTKHSMDAPPPFLSSGVLMFYPKSATKYNVEVCVKESPIEGFEFDAVAAEDIPAGSPLIRKVEDDSKVPVTPKFADVYHMSDEQVEAFIQRTRELDVEKAALANVEPAILHDDIIREHIRQTRSGGPVLAERTVTIPHPMWGGFGVFACEDIAAGEIVECGLHGKIEGLEGEKNPYVFTWNPDGKRYTDGRENTWATGSGNAMFYNSDHPSNVRMYRFFEHYRYLIVANTDIKEGEEVMHLYASSSWRNCFVADTALPKLLPVEDSAKGKTE